MSLFNYHPNRIICLIIVQLILIVGLSAQDDKTNNTEALVEDNGDSTQNRKMKFSGYPYAYYTPETKLVFGAGGIFIFFTSSIPDINPSKVSISGWYSTNKQYSISIKPVLYFNSNKLYVEFPFSFGFFVDKFWGIGNSTIETGNEEYALNEYTGNFILQVPPVWFAADRTGIIFDYNKTSIDDKKNNSYLNNDEVTGSNGGEIIGFGTDLVWDSRDHLFFPNSGTYQYMRLVFYPSMGDYIFYSVELDLRHYNSFSPDHVIAANIYFKGVGGDPPFYELPSLGGQYRMRGYFEGRYRDNNYLMMQLEYRQYFWWKFGLAVFFGAGDVAPELMKFSFTSLKYSYGLGLRFLFNSEEKVNLRMDLGLGNDGNSGIYFGLEEAF